MKADVRGSGSLEGVCWCSGAQCWLTELAKLVTSIFTIGATQGKKIGTLEQLIQTVEGREGAQAAQHALTDSHGAPSPHLRRLHLISVIQPSLLPDSTRHATCSPVQRAESPNPQPSNSTHMHALATTSFALFTQLQITQLSIQVVHTYSAAVDVHNTQCR